MQWAAMLERSVRSMTSALIGWSGGAVQSGAGLLRLFPNPVDTCVNNPVRGQTANRGHTTQPQDRRVVPER